MRKWFGVLRWVAVIVLIGLWLARSWHRSQQAGVDPLEAMLGSFG